MEHQFDEMFRAIRGRKGRNQLNVSSRCSFPEVSAGGNHMYVYWYSDYIDHLLCSLALCCVLAFRDTNEEQMQIDMSRPRKSRVIHSHEAWPESGKMDGLTVALSRTSFCLVTDEYQSLSAC